MGQEREGRIPRLTRRVFWDLAIFMVGLGLVVGLVFPPMIVVLGVPRRAAYSIRFWLACVTAGVFVCGVSWWLARAVVGRRLRLLSDRLRRVSDRVREATVTGDWSTSGPEDARIPVDSEDELGETAASFNELLAALERQERFSSLVKQASDLITLVGADGTIHYQSPSVERLLGFAPPDLVGSSLQELFAPGDRLRLAEYLAVLAQGTGDSDGVFVGRVRHRDGSWRGVETAGANLLSDRYVGALVLTSRDVTERMRLQEELRHQALHDPLTQLANRALFRDRVEHALARTARSGASVAVLFIDLDNFKAVNDSLGHAAGDELLVAVGKRVLTCLRPADTAARLGGDEFAILLEDTASDEAAQVAARLVKALRAPFALGGREIFVGASVGIAGGLSFAGGTDDLLRDADVAMYVAKGEGKDRFRLFDPGMHASILERLELEASLRRAVERDELVLHYQPIVALLTGRAVGFEALARWQHPERGLLLPADFIPVAERTGQAVVMGRWVLHEACRQAACWRRFRGEDGSPLAMSVNLSAAQLHHPDFVEQVASALFEHDLEPGSVILEITEGTMVEDLADAVSRLRELKALGVRIALDDFGVGYSSLGYLHTFPLDILKVDRSFVAGLAEGAGQATLVEAILKVAATFGFETLAEGIEDAAQAAALIAEGCLLGQGYHYARPAPATEIEALLVRSRRLPLGA